MRELDTPELFGHLSALQQFPYSVLGCGYRFYFFFTFEYFWVASESVKIYKAISEGTQTSVDKFFEMKRYDAAIAMDKDKRAVMHAIMFGLFGCFLGSNKVAIEGIPPNEAHYVQDDHEGNSTSRKNAAIPVAYFPVDAAEGFEQIIDFLSGSYIHYALTMNLHIYVSCIKQFWNTASVKRSDDVTRLQALVDRKKIVISEDVIRKILQLDDAEGVETVAEDVANEAIPSTPTPLILPSPPSHDIPSTSQVQSLPPQQPQSSPQAPPQGAEFPTHLFQQVLDTCSALTRRVENLEHDKAAQKLEIIKLKARVKRLERANKVKSSKLRRLKKVGTSQRIVSSDYMEDVFNHGRMIDDLDKDEGIELVVDQVNDVDTAETEGRHAAEQAKKQAEIYHLDLDHPSKVLSMQEDDSEVQEVVKVVTTAKLITEVVTAATS
nr:putative clathrin assembly protein At5g35200 [Tanacetum cinerariifolium]